jgi:hypothetical protein
MRASVLSDADLVREAARDSNASLMPDVKVRPLEGLTTFCQIGRSARCSGTREAPLDGDDPSARADRRGAGASSADGGPPEEPARYRERPGRGVR